MVKEKRILSYFIGWLILGYIIFFIGTNNVFASTFDIFDVTWYYRNKSNENNLLNVVKGQDTALYASTSEYVNGYTTRIEQTFTKQIQYIVNYQLQMWFSPEQELNYRSDTLQRIIDYSYTDSDFKILNVTATENWNRSSSIGDTVLTINVSMQILALNNTNAIRFGVYTTNNISIGFYNHTDQIDYYLVNNISIEENANATIIDQNNQIINGQNEINNNITNSTNTITGSITETEDNLNSSIQSSQDNINSNIDDMEDAIVDSNNQTQEVIKDQFNDCHMSYNLLSFSKPTQTINGLTIINNGDGTLTLNGTTTDVVSMTISDLMTNLEIGSYYYSINASGFVSGSFTKIIYGRNNGTAINLSSFSSTSSNGLSFNTSYLYEQYYFYLYIPSERTFTNYTIKPMLNKGTSPLPWEPYGEEICSNKIDETNDKLNGIQGALTDSSSPDTSGLENSAGWLPAGPLDSVLNLPLSLFNALTTNLNKSCNPINIPLPYVNKNITLPCINTLYNQIGITSFLSWIGVIVSGLMLYTYLLKLYKWIEDRISLNETHNVDSWGGL